MPMNINGKELIEEYIKRMELQYQEQKELQELYMNDRLADEYYDYNKSLRFTRTWEIITGLTDYADRNLILLFNACDCKHKDTLEALSGAGMVQYKNEATLRVMISHARKRIKDKYESEYGRS